MNPSRARSSLYVGIAALLALLFVSLFVGRYPAPYWLPLPRLLHDPLAQRLVLTLRLPRLVVAAMLGASLAAAGAVMQMLFRNPLVEPGFLGVSQGAAFGAALGILLGGSGSLSMHLMAIAFAIGGLAASNFLANRLRYGGWVLRLVLAGIAVSALFSAGTGVLKYLADPLTELPEITFWLLGGLWSVTWDDVLRVLPLVLPGLVLLYLLRWRLNVLALEDQTAWSLGAIPDRERWLLLLAAVAATASLTAIAGIVAWVGLIVPHLARRLLGAEAHLHLPGAMVLGAGFTVFCDDLARSALAGEIPLGILSSLLGASLFMLIMATFRPHFKP